MRRSMGLDTAANDGPLVSPAVLINPNNDDDGPKLLDIKPSRTVPLWQRVHIDGKSIRDERRRVARGAGEGAAQEGGPVCLLGFARVAQSHIATGIAAAD